MKCCETGIKSLFALAIFAMVLFTGLPATAQSGNANRAAEVRQQGNQAREQVQKRAGEVRDSVARRSADV
ncbi:MAG: hypothetical protein LC662_05125 [Rhodothermaceae bacterium]|nr:hypothetical protein [Rhodothermaceae bacterium]